MARRGGLSLVLVVAGLLTVVAALLTGAARDGLRRGPSPAAVLRAANLHRPVFQARGSDRVLVAILGGLEPGRLGGLLPVPPPPPKGIRGPLAGRYLARCSVPAARDEFFFGLATGWSLRHLQKPPMAFSLTGEAALGPSILAGFAGSGFQILLSGPPVLHRFTPERVRFREILSGDPGEAAQSARQVPLRFGGSGDRFLFQLWTMGPFDGGEAGPQVRAAQASVLATAVADVTARGGLVVVVATRLTGASDGRVAADLAFIGPGVRDRPDGAGAPRDLDLADLVATVCLQARVAQPPVCLGLPVSDLMDVYEGERRSYLVESVIQANERQIPVLVNARFGVSGTAVPTPEPVGSFSGTTATDRRESDWRRSRDERLAELARVHEPGLAVSSGRVSWASAVLVMVGGCALAALALTPAPLPTILFALSVSLALALGVDGLSGAGEAAVWTLVGQPPSPLPPPVVALPLVAVVVAWGGLSVWRSWSGPSSWKAFAAVGLLPPILPPLALWLVVGGEGLPPMGLVTAGLACGSLAGLLPVLLVLAGLLAQLRAGRARVAAAAAACWLGLALTVLPCRAGGPLSLVGPEGSSWPLQTLELDVRAIEPLAQVSVRCVFRNGGDRPSGGTLLVEEPPGLLRCRIDGVEAARRGALRAAFLPSVGPGETVSATVTWAVELSADALGRRVLRVPLAGLGVVPEFAMRVVGAPLPGRSLHFGEAWFGLPWTSGADGTVEAVLGSPLRGRLLDDLTLRFTGEPASPSHVLVRAGGAGLLLLRFDAPAPAPTVRKRWLFLVDSSASLAGEGRHLIRFLRGLATACGEGVGDCRIEVLAFDADVTPVAVVSPGRDNLFDRLEPMVRRWFGGSTDLGLALAFLGERLRSSREPLAVVLLTDGAVTQGPSEPAALARILAPWPRRHRLDVVGLGPSPTRRSLELLARVGGGRYLALGPAGDADPAAVAAVLRTSPPSELRLVVGDRTQVLADPWPLATRVVAAPASLLATAVVQGAPTLELTLVDRGPAFEALVADASAPRGPAGDLRPVVPATDPVAATGPVAGVAGTVPAVSVAALRARREPWNPDAHEALARSLMAAGQRDEALRALGGMADAAPDEPAVVRRAADLAASLGARVQARRLRWRAAGH